MPVTALSTRCAHRVGRVVAGAEQLEGDGTDGVAGELDVGDDPGLAGLQREGERRRPGDQRAVEVEERSARARSGDAHELTHGVQSAGRGRWRARRPRVSAARPSWRRRGRRIAGRGAGIEFGSERRPDVVVGGDIVVDGGAVDHEDVLAPGSPMSSSPSGPRTTSSWSFVSSRVTTDDTIVAAGHAQVLERSQHAVRGLVDHRGAVLGGDLGEPVGPVAFPCAG